MIEYTEEALKALSKYRMTVGGMGKPAWMLLEECLVMTEFKPKVERRVGMQFTSEELNHVYNYIVLLDKPFDS